VSTTVAERVSALETKVDIVREEQREMMKKIDDLLALRNRGLGMLMLVSGLLGTSFLGLIGGFAGWFKGH
jgi:hypothetical protein